MAFYRLPDGQQVTEGAPFSFGGVSYPANWLKLSDIVDRDSLGIQGPFNPDPSYDPEFYLGVNPDGSLIEQDLTELKSSYTEKIRVVAKAKLSVTDWYIIRQQDNGALVPPEIQTERQSIRDEAEDKIGVISALTTVKDLRNYVKSVDYTSWPDDPTP